MPLPSLLEQLDSVGEVSSEDMASAVNDLGSKVSLLLEALTTWKHRFESKCQSLSVQPAKESVGGVHFVADGLVPLWFPNILAANSMCHFWAFSMIVMASFRDFQISSGSYVAFPCQKTSIQFNLWTEQMDEYAENICRSIDYQVLPEMKLFGPPSTFLPMSVAHKHFDERGPQKRALRDWCKSKIEQLVTHGFKLAEFV